MSLLNTAAKWRNLFGLKSRKPRSADDRMRICRFETMEPRQLMSATPPQIHFGAVFFDPSPGTNLTANTVQVSFQGGVAGTQLTQLIIDGSKNQQGLAVGDIVWNPPGSTASQTGQSPLNVVSNNGFQVTDVSAANGGTQIVMDFTGFVSGDKLVFTDNALEVQSIDPVTHAVTEVPLVKGNDFQSAHLIGTFTAPHYENLGVNTGFVAGFDTLFAQNNATFGAPLDLPTQNYMPPSTTDQSNQTTGANVLVTQTPLPISIGGTVFSDPNMNNVQDPGESGMAGVTVSLYQFNGSQFVSTGQSTTTDANGNYLFQWLLPGTYQVGETVPTNYFAVGATAGTVNGSTDGSVAGKTAVSQIAMDGGEDSVHNNFALAQAVNLSGYVYHDTNNDGIRESGEQGLGGVTIVVTPVSTLDGSTTPIQVTTAADGSWATTGLAPGQYTVTETTQPVGYLDGKVTAGSLGGTVAPVGDQITNVSLLGSQSGVEYDFGKRLPANLSGNVSDCLTDTALSGVSVQLLDSNGNVLQSTTTDSSGNYAFTGLTPGATYGVSETLPAGYIHNDEDVGTAGGSIAANASLVQIALGDGTNATNYNFCDVRPGSIAGTVADCLAGTPLPGVTVQLLDAGGNILSTTTTDSKGNYQFSNLAPGKTYGVSEILPTGYVHNDETLGNDGGSIVNDAFTSVAVGDGVNATGYNFCDIRPASLSGSVADCVAGVPLSGVAVQLLDANGNILSTTTTDSKGNYQFTGLTPDKTYGVSEILPAGYEHNDEDVGSAGGAISNDMIVQVALGDGVNATGYDFCDVRPGSIAGSVADCQVGMPLSGVTVQLLNASGNILSTTTTDSEGNYSFTDLTPGKTYGVSEIVPGGYEHNDETIGTAGGSIVNAAFTGIALGDNVTATSYDFCDIQVPAQISGSVHIDNGSGASVSQLPTLAGVTINLLDSDGTVVATTTTNANGQYTFTGIEPGDYGVQSVTPASYFAESADVGSLGGTAADDTDITSVTLNPGANGTNYDFVVYPGGTISGFVFQDGPAIQLPQGATLTPAEVPLYRNGVFQPSDARLGGITLYLGDANGQLMLDNNLQPISAVTDSSGFYQFTGLQAGSYTVLEQLPDTQPNEINGLITAGTAGGIALNANTQLSPSIISSLAIPSSSTAIIQIPLGMGATSANNNFSVVVTQTPPPLVPPPPLIPPSPPQLPPIASAPPTGFVYMPPISPVSYVPPMQPITYQNFTVGGAGDMTLTWHLSVIDGGEPRESDDNQVQFSPADFNVNSWNGIDLSKSQWIVNTGKDDGTRKMVFGTPGAIPVYGDFAGDGKTRMGVFIDGEWFIDMNGNGVWDEGDLYCKLGGPGDVPVVGDWDGDGKDDIGVYGPAWTNDAKALAREPGLPKPHNAPTGAKKNHPPQAYEAAGQRSMKMGARGKLRADLVDHVFQFGHAGDVPVVGDWTGSGVRTIGVFREGVWYLDLNGDGKFGPGDVMANFGQPGDVPVVGDWNGTGVDSIGVFRNGKWILDAGHHFKEDATNQTRQLGDVGDVPVVGDWSGAGHTEIGVYHNGVLEKPATN